METAETLEMTMGRLQNEISKIVYQLERLDDVALSIDSPMIEQELRSISADNRQTLNFMRAELEPDEQWIAG